MHPHDLRDAIMVGFHAKLAVDAMDIGGSVEFTENGRWLAGLVDADAMALSFFFFYKF